MAARKVWRALLTGNHCPASPNPGASFGGAALDGPALQALLSATWEVAGDAMVLTDAEGTFLAANPAWGQLFGYLPAAVIGQSATLVIAPEQRAKFLERYRATFHQPEIAPCVEARVVRADGIALIVETRYTFLSERGRRTAMLSIVRDVTARRRAEGNLRFLAAASQLLSASLDYETTLAQVARLAVPYLADCCIVDLRGEADAARRLTVAHVDPDKEELVYDLQRRFPPDPAGKHPIAVALRTGQPVLAPEVTPWGTAAVARAPEHEQMLKTVAFTSYLVVPLVARGRVLGALTFFATQTASSRQYGAADLELAQEIARRAAVAIDNAQLHQQVEAERDRLRQVLAVLPEGVALANARGAILLSNAAAHAIWGQPPPACDAHHYELFGVWRLDGSPWPSEEMPLARSVLRGEEVRGEQMLVQNATTGERLPILVNSSPLRDAQGMIVGGVAAFQDISAIKELEREREEFMASASHDLKNPLATIRGNAQLLARRLSLGRATPADADEQLGQVIEAADKMTGILDELLDSARLQLGRPLELRRQPTDLVALTQQVASASQRISERHRIQVEAAVPSLVGEWDAPRLERVLANLLANAIKYSPAGGEVRVALAQTGDSASPWVELSVHDPGIGIPARDLPHVFDRYHRASNVVGLIEGSGIGLANARQIVEQHGGSLTVSSQEGAGSTFTLRLPLGLLDLA